MAIPRPHPLLVVFALWLLVFAASSQTMVIAPILPLVGDALGIREALLGTLVSAYSIMVGIFAVISGPFSDRLGRRRILLAGTGLMTLALTLHGLVTGYLSFIAVRVLAGTAGGILSGAAVSYVGDYFPYEKRGWATGWIMSGSAAGQILGIPLGVVMAGALGFRTPFYVFAGVMTLTFLLVLAKLPQPDVERSPDPVTLRRSARQYAVLLRRSDVCAAAAAFFLMFLGISLYIVYLPTWLEREIGASANQIATLFLVGGVANVLVGPQAGRISDRVGRKGIIILSCTGLAAVMVGTTLLVDDVRTAYPYFFVVMALVAMRIGPFSALLTGLVEDDRRGTLLSLAVALGQVGFAVGGSLAGALYAGAGYRTTTMLAALAVLGMAVMVGVLVPEPARRGRSAPSVIASRRPGPEVPPAGAAPPE